MILVYGDDSADERGQRISAVGIAVGGEGNWIQLESQWKERLSGIPFHAKDCESGWRDFKTVEHGGTRTDAENKALYKDLATYLAESGVNGFGVAIDLEAERRIFPDAKPLAHYKAFVEVVEAVMRACRHLDMPAKLKFDMGDNREYNAGMLYQQARAINPDGMRYLPFDELGFGMARECTRLQVADMVAFESMKALDNTIGAVKRERASWKALRETGRFGCNSYSDDWFKALKADLPELGERLGIRPDDYQKWLAETRRQHNISNMIAFMTYNEEKRRSGKQSERGTV